MDRLPIAPCIWRLAILDCVPAELGQKLYKVLDDPDVKIRPHYCEASLRLKAETARIMQVGPVESSKTKKTNLSVIISVIRRSSHPT